MGTSSEPWPAESQAGPMNTKSELPELPANSTPLQFGAWLHLIAPVIHQRSGWVVVGDNAPRSQGVLRGLEGEYPIEAHPDSSTSSGLFEGAQVPTNGAEGDSDAAEVHPGG